MDILTKAEVRKYIKLLERFKLKQLRKHYLNIVEPKLYELLLLELKSDKVLEVGRICDTCSQVCQKNGIEYDSITKSEYQKLDWWDGDIICGYGKQMMSVNKIDVALRVLKDGRYFATIQDCTFLSSLKRHTNIFSKYPPTIIYCFPLKSKISKFGDFSKAGSYNYNKNLYWIVWQKGAVQENPSFKWLWNQVIQEEWKYKGISVTVDEKYRRCY